MFEGELNMRRIQGLLIIANTSCSTRALRLICACDGGWDIVGM